MALDGMRQPGQREPRPKTGGDYVRGVARRWFLTLFLTALVGGAGTAFTLWQRPTYGASARVLIEPPTGAVKGLQDDTNWSALFTSFFNTRVQMIGSRAIAERVFRSLELAGWDELNGVDDPIGQLSGWIKVKPVKTSNLVDISLEGKDANLVARIVNSTVDEFIRYEQELQRQSENQSRTKIDTELKGLDTQLARSDGAIGDFHKQNDGFLLNGESVETSKLQTLAQAKTQADLTVQAAKRSVERFQMMRKAGIPFLSEVSSMRARDLQERIAICEEEIARRRNTLRPEVFENDERVSGWRQKKAEFQAALKEIGGEDVRLELLRLTEEAKFAEADRQQTEQFVSRQRESVLAQQNDQIRLQNLTAENAGLRALRDFVWRKRLEIDIQQGLMQVRIRPIDRADPPRVALWPIKWLQIPAAWLVGLFLGCLSAMGLESLDTTVRDPLHLSEVISAPLRSVAPRFGRRELIGPAGWRGQESRPPAPRVDELFRSLRSSLLGAERDERPLRSILITSPKPGEGKSMTAAHLASAFARAGERVLLLDLDLRTDGLRRFFRVADQTPGLVEVLRDNVAWPSALKPTGITNLDLLPVGEPDEALLDIVGTVEMSELLQELGERFDRVILDAPPLLGLADARLAARFVDGVILVCDANRHSVATLDRVREMVEQESLPLVGVALNRYRGRLDGWVASKYRRPKAKVAKAKRTAPQAQAA